MSLIDYKISISSLFVLMNSTSVFRTRPWKDLRIRFRLWVFGVICLIALHPFQASAADSSCVLWQDAKAVVSDFSLLHQRIVQSSSNDWFNAGVHVLAISGAETALMYSGLDERVQDQWIQRRSSSDTTFFDLPNRFGTTGIAAATCVAVYGIGWISESPTMRLAARSAAETMIVAGVVTTLTKVVVGRARPDVGAGATSFQPFSFDEGHYALPSGHSTVAFSLASAFARSFDNIYLSIGLYSLATATASARMYYNKHWLSDVALGAGIGIASSSLVQSLQQSAGNDSKDNKHSLLMYPRADGFGLLYAW